MDVSEFEDCLDRFGEDFSRWPSDKRTAALALLSKSDEAKALLRDAQDMRGLFAGAPVAAPAGLADRIVAQASLQRTAPADAESSYDFGAFFGGILSTRPVWRVALLSACFAAGLFFGVFHSMSRLDVNEVDLHDFVATVVNIHVSPD